MKNDFVSNRIENNLTFLTSLNGQAGGDSGITGPAGATGPTGPTGASSSLTISPPTRSIQYNNDGELEGDSNLVFYNTTKSLGIQSTREPEAPLHIENNIGTTITSPGPLTLTLQSGIINPPSSYNLNVIYEPNGPTGISFTVSAIADITGAIFIGQYGSGGYLAVGQTINYTIYAYRNINGAIVCGNPYVTTFTDTQINGLPFSVNINIGYSGPFDGFIIYKDVNGSFPSSANIGANSIYDDNDFGTSDPYIQSIYQASQFYTFSVASYTIIEGVPYRGDYETIAVSDSSGSRFTVDLVIEGGTSPFILKTDIGGDIYYFDLGNNAFYNNAYGSTLGSISDFESFSSAGFSGPSNYNINRFYYAYSYDNNIEIYSQGSNSQNVVIDQNKPYFISHYIDSNSLPLGTTMKIINNDGNRLTFVGDTYIETPSSSDGDITLTPNFRGYQGSEQTIYYDLYAKKIFNGTECYSSPVTSSITLPPDGQYYVITLDYTDIPGASYKFYKYDSDETFGVYHSFNTASFTDSPSITSNTDSLFTPTNVFLSSLYAENPMINVTQEGAANFINSIEDNPGLSFNSFSYKSGSSIINIGKYGVRNGNFFIGSETEIIRLGNISDTAHTSFSSTSSDFNLSENLNYNLNTNGTLNTHGFVTKYRIISGTHHILNDNDYTVKNISGGSSVTLPEASGRAGRIYCVLNTHITSLTVNTISGTINGAGSVSIAQNASRQFQSDGANWNIIGGFL